MYHHFQGNYYFLIIIYGVVILTPLASYAEGYSKFYIKFKFFSVWNCLWYWFILPGYVVLEVGARAIYLYLIFTIGILYLLSFLKQNICRICLLDVGTA